jgi:hypothetical protein
MPQCCWGTASTQLFQEGEGERRDRRETETGREAEKERGGYYYERGIRSIAGGAEETSSSGGGREQGGVGKTYYYYYYQAPAGREYTPSSQMFPMEKHLI